MADAAGKVPTLDQVSNATDVNQKVPGQRWLQVLEWCERNSMPKVREVKKRRLYRGRWGRSPMTEKDWEEWDKWAETNAEARSEKSEPDIPRIKTKPQDAADSKKRLLRLSKPKRITPKYEKPEVEYTFMPTFTHGTPKKEKPRKVKEIYICPCFQTIENICNFWRFKAKFEINPPALKYKASRRIKELAIPRKIHPPPPDEDELFVVERKKMPLKQWMWHLRRLSYFAAPKKAPPEEPPSRGPTKRIEDFTRLATLSQPKFKTKKFRPRRRRRKPWSARRDELLAVQPSARVVALSKPLKPRKKWKKTKGRRLVKPKALKAKCSPRVESLAKPKKYPPDIKKRKIQRMFQGKPFGRPDYYPRRQPGPPKKVQQNVPIDNTCKLK